MNKLFPAALLLIAATQPSQAYVDPGTGSMLVQMAIAGIAGALFYFRQLRMQFVSWFRRAVLGRPDDVAATTTAVKDAE
jgi:hypothetical protein